MWTCQKKKKKNGTSTNMREGQNYSQLFSSSK